jgi:Uma2 family endonuclease
MEYMEKVRELVEEPLSGEELAARYRALCDDRLYANVPGKIELDLWGHIVMSPASNYHGALRTRLAQRLAPLGGQVFLGASVITATGVPVADVAWASADFMHAHAFETPYRQAPNICVEVLSPPHSRKLLREKIDAYLAAGAEEVWVVYPQSKRVEFYAKQGPLQRSAYLVDLTGLFDDA